jgi:hypothetical protein
MNAKIPARHLLPVVAFPLLFASCGTMKVVTAAKEKTVSGVSSIAKTIRPPRVQVVEVREKDLKELPSGQERALAFQDNKRQKKRGFLGLFNGPVDFKEPMLPVQGGENFGGVLPPLE